MPYKSITVSDDEFAALFPITRNADLAERLGASVRTVVRWARRLDLVKSPEFLRELNSGPNNYGWKGGRPLRDARFLDPAYAAWRQAVLERDGHKCRNCGKHSPSGRGLHAHHLIGWLDDPALRYCTSNGQTLCFFCHNVAHGRTVRARLPRPCACGCGAEVIAPRRYVSGHNWRGKKRGPQSTEHREASAAARRGRTLSPAHRAAIGQSLQGRTLTDKQRATLAELAEARRGVPRSAETKAKVSAAQKGTKRGPLSAQTREKISRTKRERTLRRNPQAETRPPRHRDGEQSH